MAVSCWRIGIAGSRGRLLGFISGDHSYSEAIHFSVLGYLQHDSLDDTVNKIMTALGSQGWLCPCRSLRAQLHQCNNKHSAASPTSTSQHLTGSASTVRAGTAEVTNTMSSGCYDQGKQRVNPDTDVFCCRWKQLQCKFYCKTRGNYERVKTEVSQSLLSLSFSGIRME